MLTSTKSDFRINLRRYCGLKNKKNRDYRTFGLASQSSSNLEITDFLPPSINSSIYNYKTLNKFQDQILELYDRNLQFYRLNEHKLLRAIQNQMKEKNYICQKQILNFLKTHENLKLNQSINQLKLQQQLQILTKFLSELYERKRTKQILIINQNIKQEQKTIAAKVSFDDFETFHENMEFCQPKSNADFISQYQSICMKFGTPQPNLRPHIKIKDQIDSCRQNLKMHFDRSRKEKSQYFYIKTKKN